MGGNRGETGKKTEERGAIVGGGLEHWSQLPNESAQAFSGFPAYASLPVEKRTIAAAYRQLKEFPEDEDVKVPGRFGGWATKYRWRERAAARDQVMDRLALVSGMQDQEAALLRVQEFEAARRETVEQAKRIQAAIESELEAVESEKDRRWKFGGDPVDKTAKLANLAAALESSARARLMALGGVEFDSD